jgi:23S rRNA maturation-related 3'-5' exoribonuclease YhaM
MKTIKLRGTGQLNGTVVIDKELELDDKIAQSLFGPKKNEVIRNIIAIHYPGVKINPKQIGIQSIELKKEISSIKKTKNSSSQKKSPTPIIFLPFKIIWRILKWLTKD